MAKIGIELWKRIERNQGYAYISDAVTEMDDENVIEIVRVALRCARRVVRILESFLRKYAPNTVSSGRKTIRRSH